MTFEIIDFHTHPFLDNANNFCMYKENLQMDSNIFLQDMKKAGISKFCGSVICWDKDFEALKKCNRDALKLREIYGEQYIPGIHIHPDFVAESIEELEFASKNNVKLIGELVPYMNGWEDYSCKEFSSILDEAEKYNMVVSLHTMNLEQMDKMASEHKNVNFVFAHPNEKSVMLKHIDIMKRNDNVYLDVSGSGISRYGALKFLVDSVGAERVLFASDYPLVDAAGYVNIVLNTAITDREKELIFSGNAKRLLGL